jgi:hypothetical protein
MARVLPLQIEPILAVLEAHDVAFIIVGGYAVNVHGVVRSTKDLDICPEPTEENLTKLAAALTELEVFLFVDAEDPDALPFGIDASWLQAGPNFTFGSKFGRIDVMQQLDGVDGYSELERNSVQRVFQGHKVRFAGYEELVAMKKATGRAQDKIDLEDLKAARGEL